MNDEDFWVDDYLGQAANEGSKARAAIDAEKYDIAWGHYQAMSQLYLSHAKKQNFTLPQTLALVGSVHRAMAGLLQLEGRHHDALVHVLYCTACSKHSLDKELKSYRPYFNRCNFTNVKLDEVTRHLETWKECPDFVEIRNIIAGWKNRSEAKE